MPLLSDAQLNTCLMMIGFPIFILPYAIVLHLRIRAWSRRHD